MYKDIIDDYITLLQYLNDLKKEGKEDKDNNISEDSKIYEVLEIIKDNISKEFFLIFEKKNELTVNKTSDIFEYYLKLVYKHIKDEIKNYQEKLDKKELEDKKNKLDNYFLKESSLISKNDFESAIRLFITFILFREEDKENKIKYNCKNVVNYLKAQDLWDKNIYNDKKFDENLNEIKKFNIQINQILNIVDIKEEDISDVKMYLKTKNKPPICKISNLKKGAFYGIENNEKNKENDSDGDRESGN